jgi:hypothetical protein
MSSCQRNFFIGKENGRIAPIFDDQTIKNLPDQKNCDQRERKENDAEGNGGVEQGFLNAAAGREKATRFLTGQTTKSGPFTLQDDTRNQGD